MSLTTQDLSEYLASTQGVELPASLLALSVGQACAKEQAMIDAGYSVEKVALLLLYSATVIACAGAPRRVSGMSSPRGGMSFSMYDRWLSDLRGAIAGHDTLRIMADAIGPDPSVCVGWVAGT
jgi:hypothetical protein